QQFSIEQTVRGCEYKLWCNKRARTIHFTVKKRDSNYTDSRDWPDRGIGCFSVMLIIIWKCVCGLSKRARRRIYRECYDTDQHWSHLRHLHRAEANTCHTAEVTVRHAPAGKFNRLVCMSRISKLGRQNKLEPRSIVPI